MNKTILHLSILIALFSFSWASDKGRVQKPAVKYERSWKSIDSLAQLGLTKSALAGVERIYRKAKQADDPDQMVRAIMARMRLESYKEEDALSKAIDKLKGELKTARFPVAPMLHSLLAQCYWRFFNANRWSRSDESTQVEGEDSADIHTWNMKTVQRRASDEYLLSLRDSEKLKRTSIDAYQTVIACGDSSRNLRPTLYDFLAHRAIEFYSALSILEFEALDSESYFKPFEEFAKLKVAGLDSSSIRFNAIGIFQGLIRFHGNDSAPDALVDADLERLAFVRENSNLESKDSLYLEALKYVQNRFASHPVSAEAAFQMAELYREQGRSYKTGEKNQLRWLNKDALEVCDTAWKKFPKSYGGMQCQTMASEIRTKSMNFAVEEVNIPRKPFKTRFSYCNVDTIYLRLVKTEHVEYEKWYGSGRGDSLAAVVVARKPLKQWPVVLPNSGDYREHSVEVAIPGLETGHYLILAGSNPQFDARNGAITFASTWVSNIGCVVRSRGGHELRVLHRETGAPIQGLTVKKWVQYYDDTSRTYKQRLSGTYLSDNEGLVNIPQADNEPYNARMEFVWKGDRLFLPETYSMYQQNESTGKSYHTYFFTDRSIYRPGQTIHFKGIMIGTEAEANEVAAGVPTTVQFKNANRQEVAHLDLVTNKYGSVQGSFIAPGALNGRMTIENGIGTVSFSVEDYKRPKFEVIIDAPKATYRFGDTVRVQGHARAYAGSAADGAQVKYRVMRMVRYPDWCWRRVYAVRRPEVQVGGGVTATNDSGGFTISFKAMPDPSVPVTDNPFFTFVVYADVTDEAGETRSTTSPVGIGYTLLTLKVNVPAQVNRDTNTTFGITAANLNGVSQPAKGKVFIYRLKAPGKTYRKRLWQAPDTSVLTESQHMAQFPTDIYTAHTELSDWERMEKVYEAAFDTEKAKTVNLSILKKLELGAYVLETFAKDPFGQEVKDIRYFTLFSGAGNRLPYAMAEWFVPLKAQCEPGEKAVFLVGSSYDKVHAVCEIERRGKLISRKSIEINNEQKRIEIPVEEKHRGDINISFGFVRDNRSYLHNQAITVPWTNKELKLSFETFRSKLVPGQKDEWRIKIAGPGKDKVAAEMVAALYDASLDAFKLHKWFFPVNLKFSAWGSSYSSRGFSTRDANRLVENWNVYPSRPSRLYPQLDWGSGWSLDSYGYGRSRRGIAGIGYGRGFGARAEMRRDGIDDLIGGMFGDSDVGLLKKEKMVVGVGKRMRLPNAASLDVGAKFGFGLDRSEGSGDEMGEMDKEDLSSVSARANLNETVFFYPCLVTNDSGDIIVKFQIPEALTKWKMLGLAHTKDAKFGQIENTLVTQKDLMVMPNVPRFLRENDRITLTAKVSNLSNGELEGTAQLFLADPVALVSLDSAFENTLAQVPFKARKGQSAILAWNLRVPAGLGAVNVKIVAKSGSFSDGEEQTIPILSNRMLVTEAMPLQIRKKGTKKFSFEKLRNQNDGSKTLRNHKLTLEFTSNPVWYAIQALPYLMEYPQECAEQTFAKFYANAIAAHVVNSSPRIKAVFDAWRNQQPQALLSNLEKNQDLKTLFLEETPWLLDGKDETERKSRIAGLFDLNNVAAGKDRALARLMKLQYSNGGWPWFEGMPEDRYITQYIAIGMGRLDHLGIIDAHQNRGQENMLRSCLLYIDGEIQKDYQRIVESGNLDSNNLGELQIQYLYARSYFPKVPVPKEVVEATEYFLGQAEKYWLRNRRYMQGMIALTLSRNGKKDIPGRIVRSLKENSITSEEMGMYWKEMYRQPYAWFWYDAPIECQALMIEAFDEVAHDTASVEDLKTWLLKSKQTQDWRTTKATTEACYALLLHGVNWLGTPAGATITLGNTTIDLSSSKGGVAEAGTGYVKTSWAGHVMKPEMGNITITKQDQGVSWGAIYWQYFEQLDKITPHQTPLRISKRIFLEQNTQAGRKLVPLAEGKPLRPGDKIKVRIELRVDRDMEYVHMKDMRASGLEPLNVLSGYRWQSGLGYYESTRDASTNFFFARLPKGTFVFEYPLVATHAGDFSNGITSIECMYAPEFASHSEGLRLNVAR